MKNIIALRFCLALMSSGILAFLSQIAVFIYTRWVSAPIPAGEIIGLSAVSISAVLGFIWFFILLIVYFIKSSPSLVTQLKSNIELSNIDFGDLKSNLYWWGVIPSVIALVVSTILVFCPICTSNVLQFLGYGGGLPMCQLSGCLLYTSDAADE